MKPMVTILSLLIACSVTLTAQSSNQNILQETFKIKIAVLENNNYEVLSFVASDNQPYHALVVNPGDLPSLLLSPGAVIDGYFRFESFASEGGLGTTRVYKGKGYGRLRIAKIRNTESGKVPVPSQTIQLGLAIW